MKVHLLNSAMMPAADGIYESTEIAQQEFFQRVRSAHAAGQLESYIGYRSTAELIERYTGVFIPENRKETRIKDGDTLLICRLKYRLGSSVKADQQVGIDHYEFRVVTFSAPRRSVIVPN